MFGNGINIVFKTIKNENEKLKSVENAIKTLAKNEALVGIPQESNTARKDSKVTQAELLYIHTNGSPARNIPARDVLESAIKNSNDQIKELMKESLLKALEGDINGAMSGLKKVGIQGANVSKEWFTNPKNNWSPNSKLTIKAKKSERPLIDNGELRKSITSIVREKGKTKK